ncbi:MAG TPA: amidohydrolase family protein [Pyrinomonadaceae bacterium]|nr:amidohydrolase family protein [Pyrinomonadaceae bacterium]
MTTLYCARWVLPVTSPAIAEGAIAVEGDRIVSVGTRAELANQFPQSNLQDFGEAAIIPGLVNAHSHLELTAMRGFLENEETDFFAWLRKLTFARLERMTAEDLYVSAAWGACEAIRAGVTCVADASDSAATTMQALNDAGLAGVVFQESFGPDPRLAKDNFEKLRAKVAELRERETSLVRAGVSPHAPYTVCAPQLEMISRFAIDEGLPVMMHAAETSMEVSLIREGKGPFAEGLRSRSIDWQAPGISPIKYLSDRGILNTRPLLAHCIHVDDADIEIMKSSGTSVAHCPKSNAKLGHGFAPLLKFVTNEIAVGLGSDSVASNNTCDLLEEARFGLLTSRLHAEETTGRVFLGAADALRIATTGGAEAVGLETEMGALRQGARADFAVVSLGSSHQIPSYEVTNTLIFASSGRDVILTAIAGREVYREGRVTTVDEERLRARMNEIAEKL